MLNTPSLLLLLCGLCAAYVSASQDADRQIIQHVDAHLGASTVFLKQLVNINSGTMNFASVEQVGMLLKQKYDALSFTTE